MAAFLPAALAGNAGAKEKAPKNDGNRRPNIIYIMSDDHAYQTISAYGHQLTQQAPTPNLDRIAKEGMLFNRAFVENSISTPSRACLMTGLYSHQSGQVGFGPDLDPSKVFFSELLQQNGYQTAVVGKWHLECEPKGFDYYRIVGGQGDYYNPAFRTKESEGKYIKEEGYATTLITDYSLDFIENRDPDKPFCMLIHHKAPHRSWWPEEKYLELYEDLDFPLPETFYDDYSTRCSAAANQEMSIGKDMTMIYDLKVAELLYTEEFRHEGNGGGMLSGLGRMTPEQRSRWVRSYFPRNMAFMDSQLTGDDLLRWKYQRYVKDYLRCIKSVDDQVGRVLDYLKESGLDDNTIVIYTSDQGFYMGEHGWFDKRFMYEESFRTPLLVRYPGHIEPGTVSDALVQNIDYAPTLLSLAGVAKPAEMSGRSFEPLFKGKTPKDWRTDLYYHYYEFPAEHAVRRHDGVRTDRYKLIHFYGTTLPNDDPNYNCNELYDLQQDPNEVNNLCGDPRYTEVQKDLQARLDKYRRDLKITEY